MLCVEQTTDYWFLLFFSSQGQLWPEEAAEDEHGEEDYGAAAAGRVQPSGQRAGPHAPAPPLL